jgi:hypothetical protein
MDEFLNWVKAAAAATRVGGGRLGSPLGAKFGSVG